VHKCNQNISFGYTKITFWLTILLKSRFTFVLSNKNESKIMDIELMTKQELSAVKGGIASFSS